MTVTTFAIAAYNLYVFPSSWAFSDYLRHAGGLSLIALQVWTSISVYDALGEFGWFYGDFFIPEYIPKLKYSGIYRFLNNPEKIIGQAGYWGMTWIADDLNLFLICLVVQVTNHLFLEYVEKPHMKKIYGEGSVRKEGGTVQAMKEMMEPIKFVKVIKGIVDWLIYVEKAQQLADEMGNKQLNDFVNDKKERIRNAMQSLSGELSRLKSNKIEYQIGECIEIYVLKIEELREDDWICVSQVNDNASKEITKFCSRERKKKIKEKEKDRSVLRLEGQMLPNRGGWYEVRLHFAGTKNVLAISDAFQISSKPGSEESDLLSKGVIREEEKDQFADMAFEMYGVELDMQEINTSHEAKRIIDEMLKASKIKS